MSKGTNSFFTLNSVSSTSLKRCGRISIPSLASGGISTPCLLMRTSRFLVQHLTPDNLDLTLPADSSILEMNIDYIIENEAILKNCPMSLAELAGVSGKRAICLATRVHSVNEKLTKCSKSITNNQPINGDDFVRVQNATGSGKFELKDMGTIIERFRPDFFIGPFDEHPIPMSVKRVRRSVDKNLKYEKFCEDVHLKLMTQSSKTTFPFVSSILGAEIVSEKERNVAGISDKSSGISFCDLHKITSLEERLELLKAVSSVSGREGLLRILRGSVEPEEMIKYLPFVDVFDTTFVDEVTAKGHALQLDFSDSSSVLFKTPEPINLWDEKYFDDFEAISKNCTCNSCKGSNFYKRSYVHHLLKSHEMVAGVLLMMHNLHQYYRWLEHLKAHA